MKFRHTILIFVFLLIYSGVSGVMSVDHSNAQESEVAGLSVTPSNTGSGAGGTGNTGSGAGGTGNTGSGAGGTGSGGSGGGVVLFDPIDKSIEDIFLAILDIILVFAIPIILFFIIWAGFLYVTAQGSEDQVKKATTALTYAVIGGLLVLGAKVLLAVITNTINVFA